MTRTVFPNFLASPGGNRRSIILAPMLFAAQFTLATEPAGVPVQQEAGAEVVEEEATAASNDEVAVNTLLDDDVTTDLHDDTTILRDVGVATTDESGAVLFDALRIWVGGAVQYDYYNFDGIYNHSQGGDRSEGGAMRRLEATVRSQLFDWGELKAQYDLDQGLFRDLYLRWVAARTEEPLTITLGNQKEPLGLDNLVGNKFGIAQERAAPAHAFGAWRSLGLRLHKSFELGSEERKFNYWEGDSTFMTTSVGLFTEDIESTNDTDLALTGRITAGRQKQGTSEHIGLAFSYREGDFYRISMRPEIHHAQRITLAKPEANTAGIIALEGAFNKGPLHLQVEAYGVDYAGRINGYGAGGYFQAGWYLTGESRNYQPKWGIPSPHTPRAAYSLEVFARLSHTRGDDDLNGWNDYTSLTLGGNFFYRKIRASVNVLYGESRQPLDGEEDGLAFNVRAQYLF